MRTNLPESLVATAYSVGSLMGMNPMSAKELYRVVYEHHIRDGFTPEKAAEEAQKEVERRMKVHIGNGQAPIPQLYRHRLNPPMYELFYSTGGHGGPYHSLEEAEEAAKRLIRGNVKEKYIDIMRYPEKDEPNRWVKVKTVSMLIRGGVEKYFNPRTQHVGTPHTGYPWRRTSYEATPTPIYIPKGVKIRKPKRKKRMNPSSYRKRYSRLSYKRSAASGAHLTKIYDHAQQIFATGSVNSGSYGVRKSDKFTHKFSSRPAIFGVPKSGLYYLPGGSLVLKGSKRLFKVYGASQVSANPSSTKKKYPYGTYIHYLGKSKASPYAVIHNGKFYSSYKTYAKAARVASLLKRNDDNPGLGRQRRRARRRAAAPGAMHRKFRQFGLRTGPRRFIRKAKRRRNLAASRKWIQKAHIKKGALRMQLKRLGKFKGDGPIPVAVLHWAAKQPEAKHKHLARRARFALKMREFR